MEKKSRIIDYFYLKNNIMNNKNIGNALIAVGIGGLIYLYFGVYKPKMQGTKDAEEQFKTKK
jgi:hypothetical protein